MACRRPAGTHGRRRRRGLPVIRRGDVRWFRFASPDKRRPVLVLGRDDVLDSLSQIAVVPLSTAARGLAWEVALGPVDGLPSPCAPWRVRRSCRADRRSCSRTCTGSLRRKRPRTVLPRDEKLAPWYSCRHGTPARPPLPALHLAAIRTRALHRRPLGVPVERTPREARVQRDGRSGEALVCLGCGHIDYFMHGIDTLLMQAGVTEVQAASEGPYR